MSSDTGDNKTADGGEIPYAMGTEADWIFVHNDMEKLNTDVEAMAIIPWVSWLLSQIPILGKPIGFCMQITNIVLFSLNYETVGAIDKFFMQKKSYNDLGTWEAAMEKYVWRYTDTLWQKRTSAYSRMALFLSAILSFINFFLFWFPPMIILDLFFVNWI